MASDENRPGNKPFSVGMAEKAKEFKVMASDIYHRLPEGGGELH